jgi:hypothetical protein
MGQLYLIPEPNGSGYCSLCNHPIVRPNPECARCWFRLHPAPLLSQAEQDAIDLAEKAKRARLEDLSRLHPIIVGLVACGEKKKDGWHQAREIYTSNIFRASLAYLESVCHEVYILSGKHHLLAPDRVIEKYSQRVPRATQDAYCWGRNTATTLVQRYLLDGRVLPVKLVIMAGADYTDPLLPLLDWPVTIEMPLGGMDIFERQHWLSEWRKSQ